jgi:hypothetical protein
MTTQTEESEFNEALEKLIFQPKELKTIGKSMTKLLKNEIKPEEFKTILLESRARILNDIVDLTRFYINFISSKFSLQKDTNQFQEELNQKNALLQDIAKRLYQISQNSASII